MAHAASHPPRCTICNRFMPWSRSQIVREYSGTQMQPDCDDVEVGICEPCETKRMDLEMMIA